MNNLLKYALMATGAVSIGYAGYKTYEYFTADEPKPETAKETKEETNEPVVKEEPEEPVVIVTPVKETTIEVESETIDMIESEEEIVNEPTALEDVIKCFTQLLLLEDQGEDIESKLDEYCGLILTLKKAKGLNNKVFKAIIKRSGVQPNSREWSRLFTDLKHYEATEELN